MIIITGAAGFIGSCLVHHLNSLGIRNLLLVDSFEKDSKKWKNLLGAKFEDLYSIEDFFSLVVQESYDDFFKNCTHLIHLGAISSTTETDGNKILKYNFSYSKELFKFAIRCNLPFIYASSAATYGALEENLSDSHGQIPLCRPLNLYGFSKQLFDEWVLNQTIHPPLWFGLKFFNVFGFREFHKGEMRSMALKAFEQFRNTGTVKLFKSYKEGILDGHQARDFIYVKDICKAIEALMRCKHSEKQGIYNLGSGRSETFLSLIEFVAKSLKISSKVEFIPMPEEIKHQYQYRTCAEMSKWKKNFPQVSFTPLEAAVEEYVQELLCAW